MDDRGKVDDPVFTLEELETLFELCYTNGKTTIVRALGRQTENSQLAAEQVRTDASLASGAKRQARNPGAIVERP